MGLVAREQRTLRWSVLRDALWLRAPRAPRTGRRGGKLWLVVLPLIVAARRRGARSGIRHPGGRDLGEFLDSDAGHALLSGAGAGSRSSSRWSSSTPCSARSCCSAGYLLPRMNGVFGRRDWLANGVLFAAYHLHVPWVIPAALLDTFILAYPSKRYRSALIGIAVHSAQSVFVLALVLSWCSRAEHRARPQDPSLRPKGEPPPRNGPPIRRPVLSRRTRSAAAARACGDSRNPGVCGSRSGPWPP